MYNINDDVSNDDGDTGDSDGMPQGCDIIDAADYSEDIDM